MMRPMIGTSQIRQTHNGIKDTNLRLEKQNNWKANEKKMLIKSFSSGKGAATISTRERGCFGVDSVKITSTKKP